MKKADLLSVFILLFVLFTIVAIVLAESFEQTVSIPAGATRSIALQLSWGDTVKGAISVSGGILHPGVEVRVTDPSGNTILDLGTVTDQTSFEFSGGFIRGAHKLSFINPSWVSQKTVTLTYEIETNPLMRYNYEIILVAGLVVGVATFLLLYKRAKRKRLENLRVCPNCSQKVPIQKTTCPYCGFDITRSIRCGYCNAFYDRSLPKCPNCGAESK